MYQKRSIDYSSTVIVAAQEAWIYVSVHHVCCESYSEQNSKQKRTQKNYHDVLLKHLSLYVQLILRKIDISSFCEKKSSSPVAVSKFQMYVKEYSAFIYHSTQPFYTYQILMVIKF